MTISELQVDIINAVLRVTDVSVLSRIRDSIMREVERQSEAKDSIWKGAATELRRGVTFEDLMEGQGCRKVSFEEFTRLALDGEWEVSLEELLGYSD